MSIILQKGDLTHEVDNMGLALSFIAMGWALKSVTRI